MAVSTRSRSLIDPFNEKVRERIFGFGSRLSNASSTSGSEHESDINDAPSNSRLSYLVQNFLENSDVGDPSANETGGSDDDFPVSDPTSLISQVFHSDRFRTDLLADVSKAVEMFSLFSSNQTVFIRSVMTYLRDMGYNAGICKTKWEAVPRSGLIAGTYEFIDVVRSDDLRYVVDLNLAAHFQMARETERYIRLIGALPRIFVGKSEDMKRITRIMADELKRSVKMLGMSLPPWRKHCYLQAKWFGPYRRTVNQLPNSASATVSQEAMNISTVKCRSVGFFASVAEGERLVAPPTTRTR